MVALLMLPWHVQGHAPVFGAPCGASPLHDDTAISQVHYYQTMHDRPWAGLFIPARPDRDQLAVKVAFRQSYNGMAKFKLYMGCMNQSDITSVCSDSTNELPRSLAVNLPEQWPPAKLEPFTQSSYYMPIELENVSVCSAMASGNVSNTGYGIMLHMEDNSSTHVLWMVVLGTEERFTLAEMFWFPVYMHDMHGSFGNARYRLHVLVVIAVAVALLIARMRVVSSDQPMQRLWRAEGRAALALNHGLILLICISMLSFATVAVDTSLHFVDSSHEVQGSNLIDAALYSFVQYSDRNEGLNSVHLHRCILLPHFSPLNSMLQCLAVQPL